MINAGLGGPPGLWSRGHGDRGKRPGSARPPSHKRIRVDETTSETALRRERILRKVNELIGGGMACATASLFLVVGLSAVCPAAAESGTDELPLAIEEILSGAPKPEDYSESVSCLRRDEYQQAEALNRELVLFKGRRGKYWLNRLRRACLGLRRGDTLAFEMRDNRLCNLDTFSSVGTLGRPLESTSARCSLGKFETISPEQAELLKESLKQ